MLGRLLLGFGLGLALSLPPVSADEAGLSEADRRSIRGVIESQLQAFRRNDAALAFSFAAPGIREKFGTPENFMTMVRTGYPAVYRPREVEFRGLRRPGREPVQEVLFVGPDGAPVLALYAMQRQPDGSWRINGVYMLDAPDEMI
ncbi:MAG: DUF4864 domain-containing protein [Kiloniellaceae bacterium]